MSISYELAKKLKDAGFPQKGGKSHEAYYLNAGKLSSLSPIDFDMYKDVDDDFRAGKLVYIPTLSELIEACGEKFISLVWENPEIINWRAHAENTFKDGNSPEEAVANLWLELNKK